MLKNEIYTFYLFLLETILKNLYLVSRKILEYLGVLDVQGK
jgi:hypothetical protein